jgi:peptidoglycan/xylan/chitin deacetylase (PgdA/CDA1 family)
MMQTRVPVLTWHGYNIFGNTYATNDLIAFGEDLHTIAEAGFDIVPLVDVAHWVRGARQNFERPAVALTCDDGTDFDWHDLAHPEHGPQTSFASSLRAFRGHAGRRYASAQLTSFVIASPAARQQIVGGAMQAQDALNDQWWREANESGLLGIESHGWDHNHPTVTPVVQREQRKGDFFGIDTFAECDAHVRASANFIESKSSRRPKLFAYPWTQASDYMRREYMPTQAEAIGIIAAFGGASDYVHRGSDPWYLPRFVFGPDWNSKEELLRILDGSLS